MSPKVRPPKQLLGGANGTRASIDGEVDHPGHSIVAQCRLLEISRLGYYHECREDRHEHDLANVKLILAVLGERPFYGYWEVARKLQEHPHMRRKWVRRFLNNAVRYVEAGLKYGE